ncbi:F-box-like domain-containing protein [Hirsutella rhossiliensis]|uniref:F-box-like domain-containing protein n=1 Tax=Hirsutella rhossiliensis TaxID=111463 RepID=A0A9P8N6S4_9HYPO|nr:f-box-like domain-containing protein [Hirsutella rhossiliensis]KAH0967794.1 f-box-like domain-containing protein [Hirsutella rhossiliensis]
MDPFSPVHQTDEGYSEDPLNPTLPQNLPAPRSLADLPSWLASHVSALPLPVRTELTMGLLDQLPTSAIAEIVQRLNPRLYIDFIQYLPAEICLKILGYVDPSSLVSVMKTCRAWHSLALDRKLWERLFYLEGWKAVPSEIDIWEAKVNVGLNGSVGHMHRVHGAEGHASKVRAVANADEDLEMTDNDRILPSANEGSDVEMSNSGASRKGKGVDRGFASLDHVVRAKRKEPGGSPEPSPPLMLPPGDNSGSPLRSTLWAWDGSNLRFRINWKYLYNMRRRLESNWELGKCTTFQLPHPVYPEEGHQECVYTLQFDADYLVSGSRDQTMRIWNMHTRRLVRPPLVGHHGSVLCLQFDASPVEDILVSGSSDSNVFIWKFSTGELVQRITDAHRESVLNVRFDKRILVTSSKDKTIKIFNRRPLRYGDLGYGTPDVAVDRVGTSVKRYGFEPDLAQELPVKEPFTLIGCLEGHGAAVNAIQVRDRTIVSVSGDRHIKVWNWPDWVCTQTIPAHDKGIACVEFDERRIVAQLRGHSHLVRTVQAGFGDLPYSKEEDEAQAKAVDAEYFRAVEAGEINHDNDRRSRRTRRVNAGSSRPAEIQAYGAKIPPGGGGGRKYGRIVSGSYDQSIIIWRRDKEGVWKPAHHLRQEEAAAAAQRNMTAAVQPPGARSPPQADVSPLPIVQTPGGTSPRPRETMPGSVSQGGGGPLPPIRDPHGDSHGSARLYMALIDQVVPLGAAALEQALRNYPVILAYQTYLQTAIEREPSAFVRSQLRQVVGTALSAIQDGQSARQRLGTVAVTRHPSAAESPGGPASSGAATAGLPDSRGSASGGGGASAHQHDAHAAVPEPSQPVPSPADVPAQSAQTHALVATPAAPPAPLPAPPQPAYVPLAQQQRQPAAAAAATAQDQNNGQLVHHHPHIAAAENAPARVFKLQFDARKIVCCSQAPVIVGWDFCNGEAELEEASRFFATVD